MELKKNVGTIDEFFKNQASEIKNHEESSVPKNRCSFLWLSEFKIVFIFNNIVKILNNYS